MKMKEKNLDRAIILLMAVLTVILAYNQMQINAVLKISPTGFAVATNNGAATNNVQTLGASVVPTGIPKIYGQELKVSYDDISPIDQQKADTTIRRLGYLDDATQLNEDQMKRYIGIASKISCEYCCGVDSIIFSDGKAACGCEHSFAMRGLAKYLIKNHGSEYTNDAILEELGKWKTLFFPGPITKKAQVLKAKGVELNYINLASNKYRGAENGN